MVISFKNINGGGGGYVLPVATSEVLGGVKVGSGLTITSAGTLSADAQPVGIATTASTGVVKIGSGITVDSAGTISAEGGGVEVVSELPASGTDGQMVLLDTVIPEKHIEAVYVQAAGYPLYATAIGITEKIKICYYVCGSIHCDVYVNPDNSVDFEYNDETTNCPVGETTTFAVDFNYPFTATVETTGFTINRDGSVGGPYDIIQKIDQKEEEKQVLYTWSDSPELTADIDYTASFTSNWCVRFKYSEIADNTTIAVTNSSNNYRHFVYKNGELRVYASASADTYTATTYTTVGKYGIVSGNYAYTYWNDSEIVMYQLTFSNLNNINIDAFYSTGWHKYLGHRVSSKAFYKDYVWYDEDYGIIIKNNSFPIYDVEFKVNPNSSYNIPYRVYSKNNSTIGPFFAPTTTGTTGYVCVAGNGWAAPTWVSPETITNGVKFWKGTQAEYDALQSYDSSTLYIITDNGNNAV